MSKSYGSLTIVDLTDRGISNIVDYYKVSERSSGEIYDPSDTEWSTDTKTPTNSERYLWNYEVITYSDNTTKNIGPRVMGVYGADGNTVSIKSEYTKYAVTTTSTQPADSKFTYDSIPTSKYVNGTYLWSMTVVTYDSGGTEVSTKSYTVSYKGTNGQNATSYWMNISSLATTKKDESGEGYTQFSYSPDTITMSGKKQTGNEGVMSYNADFAVYLNGNTETAYKTESNVSSSSFTLPSNTDVTQIRCVMYMQGTTTILDEQTVSIVSDGYIGIDGVGYTIALSNESHGYAGKQNNAISSEVNTSVIAYKNEDQISSVSITRIGDISSVTTSYKAVSSTIPGIYAKVTGNGSSPVITIKAEATDASDSTKLAQSGSIPITISADSKTFTKYFNFTVNLSGNSISIVEKSILYATSTSGTTVPTTGWQETVPEVAAGSYMWTSTYVKYSDNTETTSYSVSYKASTTYSYSVIPSSNSITKSETGTLSPASITFTSRRNTSNYARYWKIEYSVDGVNWITTGITQPTSSTATYTFNLSVLSGKTFNYLRASTFSSTAYTTQYSSSSVSVISDGASGNGISKITNYYQVSSNSSTAPTTWSTTVPAMTSTNKYLWNYEEVEYTNGQSTETDKRVIGVYGDRGTNGVSITGITEYYAISSSGTNPPATTSSDWKTTPQTTTTDKPYLWNYEVVSYSSGTPYTSSPVLIGTRGTNGSSVTISNTTVRYAVGTSGTTKPSGDPKTDWSTTIPTDFNKGSFLWTATYVKYSNDTETTAYSVSYLGTDGTPGSSGSKIWTTTTAPSGSGPYTFNITSLTGATGSPIAGDIIMYSYYRYTITSVGSTTVSAGTRQSLRGSTGQTYYTWFAYADDSAGTNISTAPLATSQYLGVAYNQTSATVVISNPGIFTWSLIKGKDGTPGLGVSTLTDLYYLTSSTTAPSKPTSKVTSTSDVKNAWTTAVPTYDTLGDIYYTCTQITYSDNTNTWTNVVRNNALTIANSNAYEALQSSQGSETVLSVITLYYLSSNDIKPSSPSSLTTIVETNEPDKWTTIMPSIPLNTTVDISHYKLYRCSQITTSSTRRWSDVMEDSMTNMIIGWCKSGNSIYIDGSKLYAESVSADLIRSGVIQSKSANPSFKIDLDNDTMEINGFSRIVGDNGTTLDEALSSLNSSISNIESYIKVGRIDEQGTLGVEIGAGSNSFKSRFVANKISFYEGDSEVAYLSNRKLNVTTARISSLELTSNLSGDSSEWKIITDNNGFSIKYVI